MALNLKQHRRDKKETKYEEAFNEGACLALGRNAEVLSLDKGLGPACINSHWDGAKPAGDDKAGMMFYPGIRVTLAQDRKSILGLEHWRKKTDKTFYGPFTMLNLCHDDWQIYVAKNVSISSLILNVHFK